jgi:hypothetical protein
MLILHGGPDTVAAAAFMSYLDDSVESHDSHECGDYEKCCHVGRDVVQSDRNLPIFQRNLLPSSSGLSDNSS